MTIAGRRRAFVGFETELQAAAARQETQWRRDAGQPILTGAQLKAMVGLPTEEHPGPVMVRGETIRGGVIKSGMVSPLDSAEEAELAAYLRANY